MKIRCPICRRELEDVPADFPYRPFCSQRCRTVDLGHWLNEDYRFSRPARPSDREDDEFQLN